MSTIDQSPALQLDALASSGRAKVFEDRASGARTDRAGLRATLDYVREGDVLIVGKLDRLGRSLPHLIETVTMLKKRGVGFRSITEAIDTTTLGGRLVFHLFGPLGQFERDLIAKGLTVREAAVRTKVGETALYEALHSDTEPELTRARSGLTELGLARETNDDSGISARL